MTGDRQIRLDDHASRSIERNAQRLHQRRCRDAGRPEHRSRIDALGTDHDAVRIDRSHGDTLANLDAQTHERCARGVAQLLGERLQDRRSCFDQQDAGTCRIDCAELVAQRLSRDLGQRPRELDAGWSSADDHEREQIALSASILLTLGALERDQDAPPDRDGILERFESRRIRLPVAVTEVRVLRSGRDDQPVVVERAAVGELDASRGDIDARRIREQHSHVPDAAQDPADRRGDVAGRERRGRDLIQQRLEDVMVTAIDQRDANVRVAKSASSGQPAKAAADDDDVGYHGIVED